MEIRTVDGEPPVDPGGRNPSWTSEEEPLGPFSGEPNPPTIPFTPGWVLKPYKSGVRWNRSHLDTRSGVGGTLWAG